MKNQKSFFLKAKFISIGLVIGVFGTVATTSIAAQLPSLVGKKVQAEYAINVDGEKLDTKAIVVDGVSHLPVRKVSEIYGGDISVKNKVITLNTLNTKDDDTNEGDQSSSQTNTEKEEKTENSKEKDIEFYKSSLESINRLLADTKDGLEKENKSLQKATETNDNALIPKIKDRIDELTKVKEDLEQEQTKVKKILQDLESK
ncbi:hypothetical protein [Paenibacillus dendritiformis]|uniref:hypothetical protein n=1 Tax=Paenibacillus dendritiformis TaxID=130049 RepID=UPI00387E1653